MKKLILFSAAFFLYATIFAQPSKTFYQDKFTRPYNPKPKGKTFSLGPVHDLSQYVKEKPVPTPFVLPEPLDFNLFNVKVKKIGNSIWVDGSPKNVDSQIRHKNAKAFNYLEAISQKIDIQNPKETYSVVDKTTDQLGMTHYKMQQKFKGLDIFSGEVILHEKEGKISHMNGYIYSAESDLDPAQIQLSAQQALELSYNDLNTTAEEAAKNPFLQFLKTKDKSTLLIYPFQDKTYLAYHLEVHPSHKEHWNYFIDAITGAVINKYNTVCNFYGKTLEEASRKSSKNTSLCQQHNSNHSFSTNFSNFEGPAVGTGIDLLGQQREVHSYESQGTYFLLDASRSMFKNLGDENNLPQGVVWTVDAQHIAPKKEDNNKLTIADITSGSADFNYPTAVSAHANAGVVFEYFKNTHQRNSYNNTGGNLLSFINVVEKDNEGFDNAYWAGTAMFYGNGDFQFERLPAGLDVAAHEMGHGTIFTTAALVYQLQSGALNESFADVFGAMVDRDDWKIGDDIALSSFFPTGTMRDMGNPNNGGTRLGDPGWQPKHMNEYQNLPNTPKGDNGGVHINSGIVNHVAYLIGESLGKDKLERIYYRALVNYLTRSSQFVDCRKAVIQSAVDIYGANSAEAQTAAQAFDQVGIFDGESTETQQDVETNQGAQLISYIDTDDGRINLTLTDGTDIAEGLTNFIPISRPSMTDDGSVMVYVSDDQIMRFIIFDWNTILSTGEIENNYTIGTIEGDNPQAIWRNVVISKDGSKIAAVTAELDNLIYILDFVTQESRAFKLVNPSTAEGIDNDNVLRADAMEFDYSGEFLMYDAESDLSTYTYWDIGFLNFWDNSTNDFAEGRIFKLVSGLPENVSIGNPTFAKNSPYIIALDYLEVVEDPFFGPTVEYYVYGFNIETAEFASMVKGTRVGYPNYGPGDDFVLFTSQSSDIVFDGISTLFAIPLNEDKISFADIGDLLQFKQYATWANWFAVGQRDFNTTGIKLNELGENNVKVYPNPVTQELKLDFELEVLAPLDIQVLDVIGQSHYRYTDQLPSGHQTHFIDMSNMATGIYFVRMTIDGKRGSYKVVKQ